MKLLSYDRMACACDENEALLHVPVETVADTLLLKMLSVLRHMNVDLVLALVETARVAEVNQAVNGYQEWLFYSYKDDIS